MPKPGQHRRLCFGRSAAFAHEKFHTLFLPEVGPQGGLYDRVVNGGG